MDISGMTWAELRIEYDDSIKPVSGVCAGCGEKILSPSDIERPAEVIRWLFQRYIEHRSLKHSQDDRRRMPRD